jgi:polyribonucleotide nucleotidyltransferase
MIGTGGKVIREIVATTGAKVDIDDEGIVKISSSDVAQIEAAKTWIWASSRKPKSARSTTARSSTSSTSVRS